MKVYEVISTDRSEFLHLVDAWIDGEGQNIAFDINVRSGLVSKLKKYISPQYETKEKILYRSTQGDIKEVNGKIIIPIHGAASFTPDMELAEWWFENKGYPVLYQISPAPGTTIDINLLQSSLTEKEASNLEWLHITEDREVIVFDHPKNVNIPENHAKFRDEDEDED